MAGWTGGRMGLCDASILRSLKPIDLCPEFGPPWPILWFPQGSRSIAVSYMHFGFVCWCTSCCCCWLLLLCMYVHMCVPRGVCTASSFVINAKLFSVHYILQTFATIRTHQVLFSVQEVVCRHNLLTRYISIEILVTETVSCNCVLQMWTTLKEWRKGWI